MVLGYIAGFACQRSRAQNPRASAFFYLQCEFDLIFRLVLEIFNYHYDYIGHKIKCGSFTVQFLNNTCIFLAFRKILGISHFLTKNIIR